MLSNKKADLPTELSFSSMSLQPAHETAAQNEGFNMRLASSVYMDQEKPVRF